MNNEGETTTMRIPQGHAVTVSTSEMTELSMFTNWTEGSTIKSSNTRYEFVMPAYDMTITANYRAKVRVNVTINYGSHSETIGIIGGTGSGKSTIVNAIPRFYDITEGFITIDGKDIKGFSKEELRSKVAYVPQHSVLFSGSVADNLRMGNAEADEARMNKATESAQAAAILERHEGGLEAEVLQGGKNLSGGEKQRLSIARALVRDSEFLILDDSFSALDYATEAKLRDALRSERKNGITFIVSQRPSSIMHADKIIVMEDGAVAGIGSHDDLVRDCEIYREICKTQLSGMEVTPS